jgi:hypothetical protein
MPATASLEGMARELFQREWARLTRHSGAEVAPVWMCGDLIQLLMENPHQAAERLAGPIRQLILEQSFVDENGDSVFAADFDARVERQVQRLVTIFEEIRTQLLPHESSTLSDATPLMCG